MVGRYAELHRQQTVYSKLPWPAKRPSITIPCSGRNRTHPKINLQIPRAAKLPVPDLERDRHLIVLVQDLVVAFLGVSAHLNVVPEGQAQEGEEEEGEHGGWVGEWLG